jgi:putative endonuclease
MRGEKMAVKFLKKNGYKILKTNFRTPLGEIDVIARQKDVTVFVEVKTRISSSFGPPCLSVTRAKQRHIINNALCYLKGRGLVYSNWRIDVVSIKLDHEYKAKSIELIENAVEEQY